MEPQLNWLAGKDEAIPTRANQLELALPDWLEALKTFDDPAQISPEEAEKEIKKFVITARTLGHGHANVAIALTQILAESLHGKGHMEGVPPIQSWNDVSAILRAITTAESGIELWAQAIGVDRVLNNVDGYGQ